ncbi:Maf family protein [Spirochaeta isovalerica]|uniref:dTTP/UTP pyrophosphatase n=1 Tax=Spirochaeta isovalerica TaxID=150 RepID=A0A841RFG2_9SPIO|nr:Maf family protein [Spirochaeta isovalerica]MBB6481318.1 septum formation protein [Spirochaeta isovalerica]
MEKIHLVSSSPRRQTLLTQMGIPFDVFPVETEEDMTRDIGPEVLARTIAEEKLHAFLKNPPIQVKWAVAADTFISYHDRRVGKPENRLEAERELLSLSGMTHQVLTGISLYRAKDRTILTEVDITDVTFRPLSAKEIAWYLDTEEWKGVAGSYRIQGKGECLISGINGSYSNVMGLPITRFYGMLTKLDFTFD